MGTIITKPGGGGGGTQVGYRGFKYNVSYSYDASSVPPGNIYLNFNNDGEGGYSFGGILINRYDADGVFTGDILNILNAQPFTITNSAGVSEVVVVSGSNFISAGVNSCYILGANHPDGSMVGVSYVNFGTSQKVPVYNGYLLNGSLNGATLTTGTHYLSPGPNTASLDPALRTITPPVSQGTIEASVTIGGTSTTMSINLMINGVVVPAYYAMPLPAGLTGTFPVCGTTAITNGSTVTLRIVQGAGTSYQIHGFSYKIT